jgi:hypothetical protein
MRGQGKYAVNGLKSEVRSLKYIFSTLAVLSVSFGTNVLSGASSMEAYGQIPARNLFGLHEPVQQNVDPPPLQLPKITLNGINTINGKLVFLKVQYPAKQGEKQQSEESLTLTEGQREGVIELLEINEKAGTIRVNNSGTEMTIGFDKDAGKVASSPPPAPGPGPTGGPPNIAARIRSMNPGTSGYQRMIPARTGQQVPAMAEPTLQNSAVGQGLIQGQNLPAEKPLTPEEQAVLRELEQAAQGNQVQPK